MLKLAAVFENAVGKKHNWSFNEPDPNKSPEEIRSALEAMTALHLFEKDGIRQFCKVVSAKFVETIETPLFDLSKPTPEAYVADPNNIFAAHIVSEEATQVSEAPIMKEEAVVEETKTAEVTASKAVETAAKPIDEKPAVAATPIVESTQPAAAKAPVFESTQPAAAKAPVFESNPLTAMTEKATKSMSKMIPSASAQQLEALANHSEPESSSSDSPATPKPVNPRKAQVDRVRAYHEANKKKKKGKKKKL